MKPRTSALLFALCLFTFGRGNSHAPGEVLLKFRENSPVYAAAALSNGARHIQTLPQIGVHRLRLPQAVSMRAALAHYRSLPFVEFAEPNDVVRAFDVPNDPQFGKQWHLSQIECPEGWDLTHGSSSVIIAIVDTGVDLTHPDLRNKLVPGHDFRNGDSNPQDDHGHGTHVAGIAAASTHNGIGVAGVGYACRIMPVKVLSQSGTGFVSELAEGVNFAVANGAKVVCLSLGIGNASGTLQAAVDNAWNNGVLVVAAAGNDNANTPQYPAAFTNAVGVGATDHDDLRAGFSNFGPWISVAAPGVEIRSTYLGNQYRFQSGTSMATPQVAGLAGLLWSHMGASTDIALIRERIETTTVPVGNWLAHGRIDVRSALPSYEGVARTAPLTSHTVALGQVLAGQFSSLLASDNDRLSINAVRVGVSRRVELIGAGFLEWQGKRIGLQAAVEANATLGTTVTGWFWNWGANRWDAVGGSALGVADRNIVFQTADPEPYLGPGGEVRIKISRIAPRNRIFCIRVDKVELISVSSD